MSGATHKQRVLALLSDGRPHTHHELYGLYTIAHSRVADLRRDGYRIECWREGGEYLYQLLEATTGDQPVGDAAVVGGSPSPVVASSSGAADGAGGDWLPAAHSDGQLVLDAPQFRRSAA